MKTIEEIKNEVAVRHGYDNWPDLICKMLHVGWRMSAFLKYENEAMDEHAKQAAEAQRELDIKNATANYNAEVDEDSIRNHPLVTDNI